MTEQRTPYRSILVTGAGGYIGRQLIAHLAENRRRLKTIVAADLHPMPEALQMAGVQYLTADICSVELAEALKQYAVDVVVHLAAVVTPDAKSNRALEYKIDVLGTENVLQACITAGVKKIIYSSSGAAYGYYADNPPWLEEHHPIRGNKDFAYSYHKRLVEEMLSRYRESNPELEQLIFRPGFILGATTRNQITNLFDQKRIVGLKGADSPFVIIWDQDVVAAIARGIFDGGSGIFNLAGDGLLTLSQMARLLGRQYKALPAWLVTTALWIGKKLRLTQYGPEQVRFLRYRPVLSNRRLKEEFGYTPQKTTSEVFAYYMEHHRHVF
jgi:UDP-glucose 4-epimerase